MVDDWHHLKVTAHFDPRTEIEAAESRHPVVNSIRARFTQSTKHCGEIDSSDEGRDRKQSDEQPENASLSIVKSVESRSNVKFESLVQNRKQDSEIC
jgi:hypothetical protein